MWPDSRFLLLLLLTSWSLSKVEVDILRGSYTQFMTRLREELEEKYKARLTSLQLELTLALARHSSQEDIDKIR